MDREKSKFWNWFQDAILLSKANDPRSNTLGKQVTLNFT
jgi:hypothetical protein